MSGAIKMPRNGTEVDPAQDAAIAAAAVEHGSQNKAAAHLGISRSAVQCFLDPFEGAEFLAWKRRKAAA